MINVLLESLLKANFLLIIRGKALFCLGKFRMFCKIYKNSEASAYSCSKTKGTDFTLHHDLIVLFFGILLKNGVRLDYNS